MSVEKGSYAERVLWDLRDEVNAMRQELTALTTVVQCCAAALGAREEDLALWRDVRADWSLRSEAASRVARSVSVAAQRSIRDERNGEDPGR